MIGLDDDTRRMIAEHRGDGAGDNHVTPLIEMEMDGGLADDGQHSPKDEPEAGERPQDDQETSFMYALHDVIGSRQVSSCITFSLLDDKTYFLLSWRTYKDDRTWQQRLTRSKANWDPLLPELASVYLKWKYLLISQCEAQHGTPPGSGDSQMHLADAGLDFSIDVLDMYSLDKTSHITRTGDSKSPSEALALHGYIGNAPLSPSIAVSIKTLELYRRIQLRKASFSVEAFAKVICDLYSVSALSRYNHLVSKCYTDSLPATLPYSAG